MRGKLCVLYRYEILFTIKSSHVHLLYFIRHIRLLTSSVLSRITKASIITRFYKESFTLLQKLLPLLITLFLSSDNLMWRWGLEFSHRSWSSSKVLCHVKSPWHFCSQGVCARPCGTVIIEREGTTPFALQLALPASILNISAAWWSQANFSFRRACWINPSVPAFRLHFTHASFVSSFLNIVCDFIVLWWHRHKSWPFKFSTRINRNWIASKFRLLFSNKLFHCSLSCETDPTLFDMYIS